MKYISATFYLSSLILLVACETQKQFSIERDHAPDVERDGVPQGHGFDFAPTKFAQVGFAECLRQECLEHDARWHQ